VGDREGLDRILEVGSFLACQASTVLETPLEREGSFSLPLAVPARGRPPEVFLEAVSASGRWGRAPLRVALPEIKGDEMRRRDSWHRAFFS
jgi:hypothetical protein